MPNLRHPSDLPEMLALTLALAVAGAAGHRAVQRPLPSPAICQSPVENFDPRLYRGSGVGDRTFHEYRAPPLADDEP